MLSRRYEQEDKKRQQNVKHCYYSGIVRKYGNNVLYRTNNYLPNRILIELDWFGPVKFWLLFLLLCGPCFVECNLFGLDVCYVYSVILFDSSWPWWLARGFKIRNIKSCNILTVIIHRKCHLEAKFIVFFIVRHLKTNKARSGLLYIAHIQYILPLELSWFYSYNVTRV